MEFIFSVVLICAAHLVRVYRWELFVETYEKPDPKSLTKSLGLGYLFSFLFPFRLGDVIRACYAGRQMKNGRGFSLATVIVDRYLDIVVVGMIFILLGFFDIDGMGTHAVKFYLSMSISILILSFALYTYRSRIKKLLKGIAAIFNPQIEVRMLYFFWSLIWSFKDIYGQVNKKKLILSTAIMWTLYIISYSFFAKVGKNDQITWIDVFFMLFAENSVKNRGIHIVQFFGNYFSKQWLYAASYLLVSSALLFFLSSFMKGQGTREKGAMNLLPYLDKNERLNFLRIYFSDKQHDYIACYLKINRDILVIRDYSAGSNATTMLCMGEEKNFYRKYAFDSDGEKLYQQILWLQKYQEVIPLPPIVKYCKEHNFCYYDMPYHNSAVDLFSYAHSMPKECAWEIIKGVVEVLEHSLYKLHTRNADRESIEAYIEVKVNSNLEKIQNAKYLKLLMGYEEVVVNGKVVKNLPYYLKYLSKEHLYHIFCKDIYSEIHGDLTIENIICTRDIKGKDSFYIIDPNTGNIHESPNLDYGKLLQSIHGGYEFLMATKSVEINKNQINFIFPKSGVYSYLLQQLDEYMDTHFTQDRIKSIYYHEIIHWLRLLPYKSEKDGKRVLLFYAGMLLVLDDVMIRFGGGVNA